MSPLLFLILRLALLVGSDGIMNHYATVHASAKETVVPMFVMIDGQRIFFSMEAYFYYTKAVDNAVHSHKVKSDDVIRVKVWAVYEMREGKMAQITCNALSDELLGQVNIDSLIKESWDRADDNVKAYWKPTSSL